MKKNITPRAIRTCKSMQELAELTAKVKESNTYKNSFFVYGEIEDSAQISEENKRYIIAARQKTFNEARTWERVCNNASSTHRHPFSVRYKFMIGNIFTCYWIYKQACDDRNPRAQEWENIKRASKAYIKEHNTYA